MYGLPSHPSSPKGVAEAVRSKPTQALLSVKGQEILIAHEVISESRIIRAEGPTMMPLPFRLHCVKVATKVVELCAPGPTRG